MPIEQTQPTADADRSRPAWLPEWRGADYAANTAHHRRFDDWYLEGVPLRPTDRLLDIGCGSGDFTHQLAARVPQGSVVGLDAAPSMIEEAARGAAGNESFVVAPAQDVGRATATWAPFDVVLSRSALHWVPAVDHPDVLRQVHAALRPGGWLRLECGGGDNVERMTSWLDPISAEYGGPATPWAFLGAGRYLELLAAAGFDVSPDTGGWIRTTAQHRPFDREAMVGWLRSQCFAAYQAAMPAEAREPFAAEALARLDGLALPDGSFDLTFVRLDVLVPR